MSEQPGRYQRSVSGMVGALIVLLAVIGVLAVLQALNSSTPSSPVPAVDYRKVVPYARQQATFDLLAPPSLPAGWKSTSVNFTNGPRGHWHLGCLTDKGRYVGLEQGNQTVNDMVTSFVDPHATRGRPVRIDGAPWTSWTDSGGDLGLLRRQGRTTTLVVGHEVPRAVLVAYVRSLR